VLEKLRILVISNLYPPQMIGGYERAIADCARLLYQRGHEVLVVTSNAEAYTASYTNAAVEPPVRRCLLLGGAWTQQGGEWFSPEQVKAIVLQNQNTLAQQLQVFQPHVCLAGNMDFLTPEILELVISSGIPVAHYVMNESPGYAANLTPKSSLYRYITCSDWVRQQLQQQGYPAATAQTIYPGAAVEEFYQAELPPRDRLRIAYASLVMYYKGADVLIEALWLLHAAGIEFTATIAGGTIQPEFVESLQQVVESEGLQDTIKFVGALSRQELKHLYRTHNILVFPSRFEEPFGISQIEAMAAGLTLVTSGTGGAAEIIENGRDGLIFESENAFDMANILSSLPKFPTEWEKITRQGQQRAISQFSQAQALAQLESVLLHLANR
jgi:glycogen synthase